MLGKQDGRKDFFDGYVEQRLPPKEHELLGIDKQIDFSFMEEEVSDLYCANTGRPSYQSETVNMDETGMRVNGENNWLWTGAAKNLDTVAFKNDEHGQGKQLRVLLKQLWKQASNWVDEQQERASPAVREEVASQYEQELLQFSRQEWNDQDCQRIAKRLAKHSGEFCCDFVACPGVEATNNRAERALLRPYVVKRKISGGHRS